MIHSVPIAQAANGASFESFTPIEREVIALVARSSRECSGASAKGGPLKRFFRRLLDSSLGPVLPLANPKLEALRRLACASFAARGLAPDPVLQAAREAGISEEQIRSLSWMAATR